MADWQEFGSNSRGDTDASLCDLTSLDYEELVDLLVEALEPAEGLYDEAAALTHLADEVLRQPYFPELEHCHDYNKALEEAEKDQCEAWELREQADAIRSAAVKRFWPEIALRSEEISHYELLMLHGSHWLDEYGAARQLLNDAAEQGLEATLSTKRVHARLNVYVVAIPYGRHPRWNVSSQLGLLLDGTVSLEGILLDEEAAAEDARVKADPVYAARRKAEHAAAWANLVRRAKAGDRDAVERLDAWYDA